MTIPIMVRFCTWSFYISQKFFKSLDLCFCFENFRTARGVFLYRPGVRHPCPVLFDMDIVVGFGGSACVSEGDEIDEERDEYADQGIEYAVHGEAGDAGICAMCDGDRQEGHAGDVAQCAFAHEVGEEYQRCDREQLVRVVFSQDGGERPCWKTGY